MQAHFRDLHFKSFPMIKKTLQSNEFWPLKSFSKHSRLQRGSNSQSGSPFESVWAHSLSFSCTPGSVNVTFELHFWFAPFHTLALVVSPRIRSWHKYIKNKIVLASEKEEWTQNYSLNCDKSSINVRSFPFMKLVYEPYFSSVIVNMIIKLILQLSVKRTRCHDYHIWTIHFC